MTQTGLTFPEDVRSTEHAVKAAGQGTAGHRFVRGLIRKVRWAEAHGDVFGAYMLRARLDKALAR